jgi:hypothetical protein
VTFLAAFLAAGFFAAGFLVVFFLVVFLATFFDAALRTVFFERWPPACERTDDFLVVFLAMRGIPSMGSYREISESGGADDPAAATLGEHAPSRLAGPQPSQRRTPGSVRAENPGQQFRTRRLRVRAHT